MSVPDYFALFISPAKLRQPMSYGSCSIPLKIQIINHSHRLCLFGVDDQLLADTVVSEDIPVAVEHTVLHRGLLSGFYTYLFVQARSGYVEAGKNDEKRKKVTE